MGDEPVAAVASEPDQEGPTRHWTQLVQRLPATIHLTAVMLIAESAFVIGVLILASRNSQPVTVLGTGLLVASTVGIASALVSSYYRTMVPDRHTKEILHELHAIRECLEKVRADFEAQQSAMVAPVRRPKRNTKLGQRSTSPSAASSSTSYRYPRP